MPRCPAASMHHPARLADRERAAHVHAEVQVLHRDRVGLVLVDQLARSAGGSRRAARRRLPGRRLDDAAVERDEAPAAPRTTP